MGSPLGPSLARWGRRWSLSLPHQAGWGWFLPVVTSAGQGPAQGRVQGWGQRKGRPALTRESCLVSSPPAARAARQTPGPGAHGPGREEREADLDPRGR